MARKKWYERNEVNKISQDWLKMNCKNITLREKELLRIVSERKLVRRDHLEIIHPQYRNIPARTTVMNRSIRKLFDRICIDKIHEEPEFMKGNNPAVIALDRAGAMILGVPFRRRIKHTHIFSDKGKYPYRELPANYNHINKVNELEVKTIIMAEKMDFSIIKWDLEHKNEKNFQYNEKITLIPDIFTIFKLNYKGNKPFLAFIEYDSGSEDNRYKDKFPTIRSKLEKYQKYKLSGSWKKEWWNQKIKTKFPPLIFVTEDEKRIPYVQSKGKKLGLKVYAMHMNDYVKQMTSILE